MKNAKNFFISEAEQDSLGDSANVVDGLFAIARAIEGLSRAIDRLGNNGAGPMGAIEALANEVKDGFERLASSIPDIRD